MYRHLEAVGGVARIEPAGQRTLGHQPQCICPPLRNRGLVARLARRHLLRRRLHGNRELAREAAAAWSDLSRARHHHPYELAPTANELRDLLDIAHRFAAEVARQAASHRSRSG